MRARGAGQRGQATVEYAAIVLALAVALGAAGAVAAARGGGVADAVSRQIARALCIVTGGDCDREREPCVVSSSTRTRENGLTIAVLRLGSDRTVVREQRSDGTIAVTYTEGDIAGLDAGSGTHVSVGRRAVRLSGELGASILARSGRGAVWELRDARQADALVERLRRGRWAAAEPRPVARLSEGGWSVTVEGAVGSAVQGALGLTAADVRGSRQETAGGPSTSGAPTTSSPRSGSTAPAAQPRPAAARSTRSRSTPADEPSTWRSCATAGSAGPSTFRAPSSPPRGCSPGPPAASASG
jgi:hypothetical protein